MYTLNWPAFRIPSLKLLKLTKTFASILKIYYNIWKNSYPDLRSKCLVLCGQTGHWYQTTHRNFFFNRVPLWKSHILKNNTHVHYKIMQEIELSTWNSVNIGGRNSSFSCWKRIPKISLKMWILILFLSFIFEVNRISGRVNRKKIKNQTPW